MTTGATPSDSFAAVLEALRTYADDCLEHCAAASFAEASLAVQMLSDAREFDLAQIRPRALDGGRR